MSADIRFLGHAAFTISTDTHCIAIDPFITGNPLAEEAGITKESIAPTHIGLTHGHADHIGDTLELATRCGCQIIAAFEICSRTGSVISLSAGIFSKVGVRVKRPSTGSSSIG